MWWCVGSAKVCVGVGSAKVCGGVGVLRCVVVCGEC